MQRSATDEKSFPARIVEAGRKLFIEKGFDATSMDDVASALGVSKPKIYAAYPSKQALLGAVFNSTVESMDLPWLAQAATSDLPLGEFIDLVYEKAKSVLNDRQTLDALWLLIREGPQIPSLAADFDSRISQPSNALWRHVLSRAMERGQCRKINLDVATRIIHAPIFMAVFEIVTARNNPPDPAMMSEFFHEYFGAIKAGLQVK